MNTSQPALERRQGEVPLDLLNGRKVVVKPLSWKDGRDLAGLLAKHTGELADVVLAMTSPAGKGVAGDPLARQQVMLQQLAGALMGCVDVADLMIRRTTGLSQEEADALALHEAVLILTVVIKVTVPETAELALWDAFKRAFHGTRKPELN